MKVGARRPGEVEVLQGLREGELVITHGNMRRGPDRQWRCVPLRRGMSHCAELLRAKSGAVDGGEGR